MKPRIIILMHYLELGGAEMALIGLLHALDPNRVDVDLFIYSHQGPLMKYIPEWVNLLPEVPAYSVIERPMTEALKKGHPMIVAARLMAKWKHAQYFKHNCLTGEDASIFSFTGHYLARVLPKINANVNYDLCISFLLPHDIAISKINAKKYIAWLHTDYSTMSVNTTLEIGVWSKYDHIVSISESVKYAFVKLFPLLESKIIDVENILSNDYVRTRSVEDEIALDGFPKLLSIGRFVYAKNYDNLPFIAKYLVEYGFKSLRWYIIGFGDDTLINRAIKEAGMEDHVILIGKKENPYPYLKACDIYVQPSRYEGKSVTVREAQMLGIPVAVTNYPTASSQINDGVDGVIVPLDNEGCACGLAEFINDKALQAKIEDYLTSHDFSGLSEVNKIYKLLEV